MIGDLLQKILQKNSLHFVYGFIFQRILLEKIVHREILCKFCLKFQTWIGFFSTFFEQNQKTRKLRKFIFSELHLSQFWARFIFEKKGLCSSGILKKKSKNFPNFKLEIGFFSDFAKKVANIPKLRKFICPELHLSQFSAKSENLFWSGGR